MFYALSLVIFELVTKSLNLPYQFFQFMILNLGILFNGFSSQFIVDLRIKLKFSVLARIELLTNILSAFAAIYLALHRFGIWALVIQQLVPTIVFALLTYYYSDFRPKKPSKLISHFKLVRSGLWMSVSQVIDMLSISLVTIQLGREFTLDEIGLYDRAQQLRNIPIVSLGFPVRNFSLPILRNVMHKTERLEDLLIKWQLPLLHTLLFIYSCLYINATVIIELVYGANYLTSVPIFRILIVIGMVQSASQLGVWVTLLSSFSKINLYLSFTNLFIVFISVQIGLLFGIYEAIIGLLIANSLKLVTTFCAARIVSIISFNKLFTSSIGLLLSYVSITLVLSFISTASLLTLMPGVTFLINLVILTIFTMFLLSQSHVFNNSYKNDLYVLLGFFKYKNHN
jgi:PST family polysaccharide transporter